ncbi:DoxX family protein [Desertivirga arenae]|uniref:DoxX family protein n=1 Tax=Desertivirga arenae TaxID=2810309 RepID=UPI001A974492|nr:DoxX family protein [Pedobacter sp. SYSU D00823]
MNNLLIFNRAESSRLSLNISLLLLRVGIAGELFFVHGLKKLGVGTGVAEAVPNPFHLPETLNYWTAVSANLFFPILVMVGLFTRLSVIPTLVVTLTGYFIVHANDPLLEKDIPYVYSLVFIFLLIAGPGKFSIDYLISTKKKVRS